MFFRNFFDRKNSFNADSNSRKNVKLDKKIKTRQILFEQLESRDLLTVSMGSVDDEIYSQLRVEYPEFGLPELQADLNVMTITPDDGAFSLSDLKSAIETAAETVDTPDLILIQTSASANSVTYSNNKDELIIDIDASQFGAVTIIGWGDEKFTLDANQLSRVISISGNSTVVNLGGLTIQNGVTEESGGGIYNEGTLTIVDSDISGNTAFFAGGGICNYDGTLSIVNSNITYNSLEFGEGGGIYNSGSLSVVGGSISHNSSGYGGGINSASGTSTITDLAISENSAEQGGGIFTREDFIINNCKITGNTAEDSGGGIYTDDDANLTIINSELTGNNANGTDDYTGGGAILNDGSFVIINSTIAGNSAHIGGGIYNSGSDSSAVYNSIIACNTSSDISGDTIAYNSLSSYTEWADGENNIKYVSGALFADAENGDYQLASGSLAINQGANQYANNAGLDESSTDLSGAVRFVGESIDIGAYEYQGSGSVEQPEIDYTVVTTLDDVVNPDDGLCSLREAIYYADYFSTITFADELFDGEQKGTITLTQGQLVIDKPISIDGAGRVVIDAMYASRVFYITDYTDVHLSGLTIQNGVTNEYGGGILVNGGMLTVTNSEISGNRGRNGGGIYQIDGSAITIVNCTVVNNTATNANGADLYINRGELAIYNTIIGISNDRDIYWIDGCSGIYGCNNLSLFTQWNSDEINYVYEQSSPLFVDASNGDYRLVVNSQAFNNGNNVYAFNAGITMQSKDANGSNRFFGSSIDIGAYEYQYPVTYSSIVNTLEDNDDPSDDKWSLREAILYASDYETITFAENLSGKIELTHGALDVNSPVAIDGCGRIVIDGLQTDRVFNITCDTESEPVVLNGLTIKNGQRGIYIDSGTLNVSNSVITGNENSDSGSAIYSEDSSITITNCEIYDNSVTFSGSPVESYGGSLTVINSTISGNTGSNNSTFCGGIYKYGGTLNVYNSIVSMNSGCNIKTNNNPTVNIQNSVIDYNPGFVNGPVYEASGRLANAETLDLHLRSDSIAIDNGDNEKASGIDTDLDRNARIYGSSVDIGVHEYQGDRNDVTVYSTVVNTLKDTFDLNDNEWSLREAIYYATNDVIITFAENLHGTITLTNGQLNIDKRLSINGDKRIIIDAGNNSRVFAVSAGSEETPVSLNGLTLINGSSNYGGAIALYGDGLVITNSSLLNNSASVSGGGIFLAKSFLSIDNSTISNNTSSSRGGGIMIDGNCTTIITNSKISNNSSRFYGGGLWILSNLGTTTITNTEIVDNRLTSASISEDDGGGGIYLSTGTLTLTNSTVANNSAFTKGGGLFLSGGTTNLYNTIVASNSSNSGRDVFKQSKAVLNACNTLSSFDSWSSESDNILYTSGNPLFADAENGNYQLASDSLAIDVGSNQYAYNAGLDESSTDLSGAPRFVGESVDIGAYEYQVEEEEPEIDYTVVTTLDDVVDPDDGLWSLREAIAYADENSTITFADSLFDDEQKGTIELLCGEIVLDKPISIDGAGRVVIDTMYASRVFYVTGRNNVYLNGLTIQNGNDNEYGGGIFIDGGSLTVTNSVITHNEARNGAGIYQCNGSTVKIVNCTVVDNFAYEWEGSDFYLNGGRAYIYNSIIGINDEYNIYKYGSSSVINGSNNLSAYTSWGSGTNFIIDQSRRLFIDADDGDYRLVPGSQAANNGNNNYALDAGIDLQSTDANGSSRFSGSCIDIGAYEFQYPANYSTVVNTLEDNNNPLDDKWSLREALFYATGYVTITFAENLSGKIDLTHGALDIFTPVVIEGDGRIAIDGHLRDYVFNISGSSTDRIVVLDGLTIQNGLGGIYIDSGKLKVTNSVISGNKNSSVGGGIYAYCSAVTIANSEIYGNAATVGGAVWSYSGSVMVTNSTITGNMGSDNATLCGGIYKSGGSLNVYNSIISMNSGGNIGTYNNPTVNIQNSVIDYNPGFVNGPVYEISGKLANAGTLDLHLRSDSIAIDNGDNAKAYSLDKDIDGNARIYGSSVDIGAHEYQGDRNDVTVYSTVVNTLKDSFDLNDNEWSLREALYYATENVNITFADGLYGTIALKRGQLSIDKLLSINGDKRITIDAGNNSRIFAVSAGSEETPVSLNGLTLINGSSNYGGAIMLYPGGLTITNSSLLNNSASIFGGGIFTTKGFLSIDNTAISNNTASSLGGGIMIDDSCTTIISNSKISNNSAPTRGGGMWITGYYGTTTITNTEIVDNRLTSASDNAVYWVNGGGGIYLSTGTLNLINSTVANNSTLTRGGGLCLEKGTTNLYNTIVASNSTGLNAGNDVFKQSAAVLNAYNTLSSFNSWSSGSNNVLYSNQSVQLFQDAEKGNYRLAANAPAINRGNNQYANNAGLTADLARSDRFVDGIVDIGAYEYTGEFAYPSKVNTLKDSFDLNDDEWSLREAIFYSSNLAMITFEEDLSGEILLTCGSLEINKPVTIDGKNRIIINANERDRAFYVNAGSVDDPVVLTNMTIYNGAAENGGGIYLNSGALSVANAQIVNNSSTKDGAGIYVASGALSVVNSKISENSTRSEYASGGGIYNKSGNVTVANTELSGNRAHYKGAGIYQNSGSLTVSNSTISGNTSLFGGSGIYNASNQTEIQNSIIALNYSDNVEGNLIASSNSLIGQFFPGFICRPEYDSNGFLLNFDSMDLHLRSDSIAIDSGNNSISSESGTDLDNFERIFGSNVDIGAYEYQGNRNDEPIVYSTTVNTLKDSFDLYDDEWSLREAIFYASDYASITFDPELNGTIYLTNGELKVDKALHIFGENRITIDAQQKSRVFYVDSGTAQTPVVFDGLTIKNGKSDYGGGINDVGGVLVITNCTISNNTASQNAGGVYVQSNGSLTMLHTVLSNNYATAGGGIYQLNSTSTITDCTFIDNIASRYGGGFYQHSGDATLSNNTIKNNSAGEYGGGVYMDWTSAAITQCTITGNNAVYGGGVSSNGTLTISQSEITDNTSTRMGGGLYLSYGEVNVDNSVISGNKSYSSDGGGVYSGRENELHISESVISDNQSLAQGNGGGVYSLGVLTVTDSNVINNSSTNDGGGIYNSGNFTIANSRLSGNDATMGGGVYNAVGNRTRSSRGNNNVITVTANNCIIFGNTAQYGGGIYNESNSSSNPYYGDEQNQSEVYAINCTISGNAAEFGSGIYNNSGFLSLESSIVSLNYNDNIQGDYNSENNNLIDSSDPGFVHNPIFDFDGNLTNFSTLDLHLKNTHSSVGYTDPNPGSSYTDPIEYSSVVNTLSDSFDPYDEEWSLREAIYFASEYVKITFDANLSGPITLTNGELYIDKPLIIEGNGRIAIDGNQTNQVFYIEAGTEETPVVINGLVIENGSSQFGGGLYQRDGYCVVNDCVITDNAASINGGGVYVFSGSFRMNNSVVTNNSASIGGGYHQLYGDSILTGCVFSCNTASSYGGGIYNFDGNATIINAAVYGNTAAQGGGLYENGTSQVINCSFAGNFANEGGGVYNLGKLTVFSSIISENKAEVGGGLYNNSVLADSVNIFNSFISSNYSNDNSVNVKGSINEGQSEDRGNLFDKYIAGFVCAPRLDSDGTLINVDSIDLHLRSDSIVIDAGDNAVMEYVSTDIDGNDRISGSVDMGAYEYQFDRNDEPIVDSLIVNTLKDSFDPYDDIWSLREAIFFASEGDTISFANNLQGEISLTLGHLYIDKPVTINGDSRITLDAAHKNRVFYIETGSLDNPVILKGLTIQRGSAEQGGAVYQGYSSTIVSNCLISDNAAYGSSAYGGGYLLNGGVLQIINSVISDNTAHYGGGIYLENGSFTVTNSTISGNTAAFTGDGVYLNSASSGAMYNSIVACNGVSNGTDIYLDSSASLDGYNNLSSYNSWNNNSNIEYNPIAPLFVNVEQRNYRLAMGSQASNMGDNQYAHNAGLEETSFDMAGEPRFMGDHIDIGAYESCEFSASQSEIYTDDVVLTWKQYKNAASVRLTWLAGITKCVLGTFEPSGQFTWDTTQFDNGYGLLSAEYLDESGNSLLTFSYSGLILNSDDVVIHRDNITESETWSDDKVHLVANSLNVVNNAVLTIAPNAVVKFFNNSYINTASGASLDVKNDVVFTRAEDDSVVGDTNLDSNLTRPGIGASYTRGNGSISIDDSVNMKYVTITVEGAIASNQTWIKGNVYHVTGDVSVLDKVTLTIQPGAIVKFDSGKSLIVEPEGALIAEGSVNQPIVFTSVKDDEYGGDTNGDEGFSSPSYGDWEQIRVLGSASFDHAIVRYTGNVSGINGAIYLQDGSNVTFNNSVIEYSKLYAICSVGGTFNATNSVFRKSESALINMQSSSCSSNFINCDFVDSAMLIWTAWGETNIVNSIISNISHKFIGNSSTATFYNSAFWNASGVGEQNFIPVVGSNGNIWANPLFRNPSKGDYHLIAGSPCIDAGTTDRAPDTDISGTLRENDPYTQRDGLIDIGAYEFTDSIQSSIDLEPLEILAPASSETGDTVLVKWTIANNGSTIAKGLWTDAFYLVNETTGQTVFVKEYEHEGRINADGTQSFYTELVMPNVTDGLWRFQLRTNVNRDLFEGVLIDNNVTFSVSETEIYTPLLTETHGAFSTSKVTPSLYKIAIKAGDAFSMQTDSSAPVTIYMREGSVPTSTSYKYKSVSFEENRQSLYIAPGSTDRIFYMLAETSDDYAAIVYDIQYDEALTVLGVSPQETSNMGSSTFTFSGTGFKQGMTVCLKSDNSTIMGTNVTVNSGSSAKATFDLTGQPVGEYSLVVTYNNQIATSSSPITITEGVGAVVNSWLELPTAVRPDRIYTAKLHYENTGDCDAPVPVFTIRPEGDVLLGLSSNFVNESELFVLGLGSDASAGTLKAGESGCVTFYFLSKDSTVITSSQWDDDNFNEVDARYWDSWSEFHSDLSMAVTRLVLRGNKNLSYHDAYTFLSSQKAGANTAGLSGYLRNARTDEPLGGVVITASWANGYRYDTAITDENGFYVFNYLPDNTVVAIETQDVYNLSETTVSLQESDIYDFNLTALPYGSISGKVTSQSGEALANLLAIVWTDDGEYGTAYTDANGQFKISNLPLGQYHVDIESANVYESPVISQVNVISSQTVTDVNFSLAQGAGYVSSSTQFSGNYSQFIQNFTDISLPESKDELNIINLSGDEFTAVNLIRAIYIAGYTPEDDLIQINSSKSISLNGVPIVIGIDEKQFGTITIAGGNGNHAKINVNADTVSTFFLMQGVVQLANIDFLSVASDDNWTNLASVCTVLTSTDGSFVAGELRSQNIEYFDKQGVNIFNTYFQSINEGGYVYYKEVYIPKEDDAPVIPELDNEQFDLSHNYVMLFSGGHSPESNYSLYYKSIKDLYTICVSQYHIPPENIYVLCADGNDSGDDATLYDGSNVFFNSDLSFASKSHVYAATWENLVTASNDIRTRTNDDPLAHVLVYTTDHGAGQDEDGNYLYYQFLCGWNQEFIFDVDFAWITDFNCYTTYVFSQCFSGGVLEEINMDNNKRFGMSACLRNEPSYSSFYIYDYNGDGIADDTSACWGFDYDFITAFKGNYIDVFGYSPTEYSLSGAAIFQDSIQNVYSLTYENQPVTQTPVASGEDFPIFARYVLTLGVPTLQIADSDCDSITVKWNGVANATSYELLCTNLLTGETIVGVEVVDYSDAPEYTFTGLPANSAYSIIARAVSDAEYENSPWSNSLSVTTSPKSDDPNEIIGPQGADLTISNGGSAEEPQISISGYNWIQNNADQEREYKIYFENKSTATGWAQEITVTTILPPEMDFDSFQVDQIAIGNEIFALTDEYLVNGENNTWLVNQARTKEQIKIHCDFNAKTREVTWYMRSYVKSTNDNFPKDARVGFLPPNDANHSGEGYVSYRVKYNADLNTGDVISTSAVVKFDNNEVIRTNDWYNTIDIDAPVVQMSEESRFCGDFIELKWNGSDAGSGIAQYQVYVSQDLGEYTLWQTFDGETTRAEFNDFIPDSQYSFYVLASDNVGNVGGDPADAISIDSVDDNIIQELDVVSVIAMQSQVHPSTDEIPVSSVLELTDWDSFYLEIWTSDASEFAAGKSYKAVVNYNPELFQLNSEAIVTPEGITASVANQTVEDDGTVTVDIVLTISDDGYTAPGGNTYWGSVLFTPSEENNAGVGSALSMDSLGVSVSGNKIQIPIKAMPYDLDYDNQVAVSDFIKFATVFGRNPGSVDVNDPYYTLAHQADFDSDGDIDVEDFIAFAINFGSKKFRSNDSNPVASGAALPMNFVSAFETRTDETRTDEEQNEILTSVEPPKVELVETVVTVLDLTPEYLPPVQSIQSESVQTLRQVHSSALLDLYDNQSESQAVGEISAAAVDEVLYQGDEFDFLFDESDSDDSDDSNVDLSAVLDELEFELI